MAPSLSSLLEYLLSDETCPDLLLIPLQGLYSKEIYPNSGGGILICKPLCMA